MTSAAPAEAPRPILKSPEEMGRMLKGLEKEGYDVKRLNVIADSVTEQKKLVEALQKLDPSLNGNVRSLVEDLSLYKNQLDKKEGWGKKLLKLPVRVLKGTWETMKRHPIITALVLLSLAGAGVGLYYSSLGSALLASIPDYSNKALQTAKEVVQAASEKLGLSGSGQFEGFAQPSAPPSSAPAAPMPPFSPGADGMLPPSVPPPIGDAGVVPR